MIHDLRFALRLLRRNPGFTVVAVLATAIGIGANSAVFTVVNSVLLRPLPLPDPQRLLLISYLPSNNGPFPMPPGLWDRDYLEYRRQERAFDSIATFGNSEMTLTGVGDPVSVTAATVTADFFAVLQLHATRGRTFERWEDQAGRDDSVVLSDRLWKNRFQADPRVLGQTVRLDGRPRKVIGVMPAGVAFPGAELWVPLEVRIEPRNMLSRAVVGRLKSGVSAPQALAELNGIGRVLPPLFPGQGRGGMEARVLPLLDYYVAGSRRALVIFAGAVALVLLIACANVANLFLARAAGRQQEIATRAALGARGWRLLRQLLVESTLVSLAGGALGVVLALWGVPGLLELAPRGEIPRIDEIHLDGSVVVFTFGLSLVTGIAFGLVPALQATRRNLRDSLSHGRRTLTGRHERLRGVFVVAEIALTLILLAGAGLMLKSFLRMRAVDPGFRPENLLAMTVDLPATRYTTAEQMQEMQARVLERLSTVPGVAAAGMVNYTPLVGNLAWGDFRAEGRQVPRGYSADKVVVSPGYFHAMGIRLQRGREFTDFDKAASPGVAIITESIAKTVWPGEDPIGRRIAEADNPKPESWLTIVGVVDDIHQRGLTATRDAALYRPYRQVTNRGWLSQMTFVVRTTADPQNLAPAARGILTGVDPSQAARSIASMSEIVSRTEARPLFQTRLLGIFSGMALLLAAVGIYGVLAYTVSQRTREIGIRMALGAEVKDVLLMVQRRTLALTFAGVVTGTIGALGTTRILNSYLFDVSPADPAILGGVAALLVLVALAAAWIPARRAGRVDPVVALRYE